MASALQKSQHDWFGALSQFSSVGPVLASHPMKKILITGMSGTGKSAVIRELGFRGFDAIDTDSDDCSEWKDVPVFGDASGTAVEPDWVWRENRIARLLDDHFPEPLFVSGCKSNQGKFYPQFDRVVLLSASTDVILDRIERRTTNSWGKSEQERALILEQIETVEPLLRATSDIEIDTGVTTLEEVVDALIALAGDDTRL